MKRVYRVSSIIRIICTIIIENFLSICYIYKRLILFTKIKKKKKKCMIFDIPLVTVNPFVGIYSRNLYSYDWRLASNKYQFNFNTPWHV